MRRALWLAVAAIAALLAVTSTAEARLSSCGDVVVDPPMSVRAYAAHASCATSRRVVRSWFHQVRDEGKDGTKPLYARGFRCTWTLDTNTVR